jgi:hypothetical protein
MFNIDICGVEHHGDDDGLGGGSLASQRSDLMENRNNIEPALAFSRLADVDLGCEKKYVLLVDFYHYLLT